MDKNRENKIFYAGDEFDFESIMREFGSERGDAEIDYDAIGSKPVTYDDIEDILSTDLSVDEGYDYPPEPEPDAEEVPEEEDIIDSIVDEYTDGSETEATKVFKPVQDDELVTDGISDEDISPEDYAEDGDYEAGKDEEPKPKRCERRKARSFSELVVTPFISALALIALKVQQSKLPLSFSADDDEELGEELPPEKASRFYESFIGGLHIRVRIAFVLSLVLTYISFGLPVMGAMNATAVKSAVCLILLLAVMICGLDIMTSGLIAIAHRRPNANTLITLSALFCVIDGFLAACGVKGTKLPFCAIPALTISFSLLGSLLNCRSSRIVFNLSLIHI